MKNKIGQVHVGEIGIASSGEGYTQILRYFIPEFITIAYFFRCLLH